MKWKKEKEIRKRAAALVLSAAMAITGGGFDQFQTVRAADAPADIKNSYMFADNLLYADSTCTDSTFYNIGFTRNITGPYDKDELGHSSNSTSGETTAKSVYLLMGSRKRTDGTRRSQMDGFNLTDKGFRSGSVTSISNDYPNICIQKEPGIYATEITFEFSDGRKSILSDMNGDFVLGMSEGTDTKVNAVSDGKASVKGKAYVSKWETEDGVTLDANGGTCDLKSFDIGYKATFSDLPAASRKGYSFAGWYKDNKGMTDGVVTGDMTGGSTRVKSGDTYDGTYRTLYAGWLPYQYRVTFDANAGSGTMTEQLLTCGREEKLTANAFTAPDGFSFREWNTARDGSGKSYKDMESVTDLSTEDGGSITLYAQWKPSQYSVSYDANGGTGNTDDTSMVYGTGTESGGKTAANGFSRTGYDFTGWNTESNGTGTSYKAGEHVSEWTTKQNITLYAQWKDHTYTVRYDANASGVSGVPADEKAHAYGKSFTLLSTKNMIRTGYTFTGWNTQKDGSGTSYTEEQLVKELTPQQDGEIILYAQWTANAYTVVFDANGGDLMDGKTTADTRQTFTSGVTAQLKDQTFFAKKGYAFTGWICVKDQKPYGNGDSFTATPEAGEEIRMTAQWTPRTYKVIQKMGSDRDVVNGTVTQTAVYDTEGKLKTRDHDNFQSYADQMTGRTFLGWSTKQNATVAQYPDGASFKNLATGEDGDDEVTLYGVWQQNHSSIACFYVYEDETGHYPTDRSGYGIIAGDEGSYVDYKDGLRPDTALYEFDQCVAYTDSSEKTMSAVNGSINNNVKLTGNNDENGANAQHLVYYYKRKSFTVTLKNGTGINGYSDLTVNSVGKEAQTKDGDTILQVPYGSTLTFKADTKAGYTLTNSTFSDSSSGLSNCLVTAPTGSGENVNWSLVMPDHDITIRAAGTPKTYDVTFVLNKPMGSSVDAIYGDMSPMTGLVYDKEYSLFNCDYLIPGYEFIGWTTDRAGTTERYSDGASVEKLTTEGNINLYAQWRMREYCLTFYTDADGSTYQMKLYAKKGGDLHQAKGGTVAVSQIDVPKRSGYLFQGYALSPDGTGLAVDENGKLTASGNDSRWFVTDGLKSDRALYAVWKPVSYRIAFSEGLGNASSHMESIDTTSEREVVLPPCVFTRTGYDFDGWSTNPVGTTGQTFSDMATVKKLADEDGAVITLYAMWKPHKYKIRFNSNGIGSGDGYEIEATYGQKTDLPLNTFRSRYSYLVFKGWNTDANLENAIYGNGASVTNLSEYDGDVVNLYAIWGYDDKAKYAVRTWQQTTDGARSMKDFLSAIDEDSLYGIDWGSIYNQKNYVVKDTTVLSARDDAFVAPEYDGFSASYHAEPVGVDGIVYYDYYYDRNEYSLKIDGGVSAVSGSAIATGSSAAADTYYYGEKVHLKASVPEGKHFGGWEVVSGDITLKNSQKYDPDAVISMPASNTVLKALTSDVEIPVPTTGPGDPDGGSGVVKNLGDETIPEDGIEINAVLDYRLVPDGVTLIRAESSNPKVAYVDTDGNLILGKAGTAVITLETSAGTFVYTVHMTGAKGVLEAGDVSSKYVKSVTSVIKDGTIITVPASERVPVTGNGTIGKSTSTNPKVAYVGEDGYLVFGEDGETIITTETSEGTIIYKVVIKDGKITIQSWKDENAEKPSATPAPEASDRPETTDKPAGTQTPVPGTSDQPGTTDKPAGTQTPAPGTTDAPAGTQAPAPGTSDAPAGTTAPVPGTPAANTAAGTTDTMTVEGITYKVSGTKAQVTKAAASVRKVSVKNRISIGGKMYPVTGVAAGAFKNCKKLTSVKFAGTGITIGKNAFKGCKKLKTVSLAKAKTVKISKGAFAGCKKITFRTAKNRRAALKKVVKKSGCKKFAVK